MPDLKAALEQHHPSAVVEIWSFGEHRLGLKAILRTIWAPIGKLPIAPLNHRYEWTYLYGLVRQTTRLT